MSGGVSTKVALRLWSLLTLMKNGTSRANIIKGLSLTPRQFSSDISRLKQLGLDIKYSRAKGNYTVHWPDSVISVKFQPKEFFYILYCIKNIGTDDEEINEIAKQLELMLSGETDPVYDCGPAYGITQNITPSLVQLLTILKAAICKKNKVVFTYEKVNGETDIRIVHPYKLIHTPISWYLVGYCEERKDFRNFKLNRMNQLKQLSDHYNTRDFNLAKHRGDAFWLQHDPERANNPHEIEILFIGEAARSIKEYKFHRTQTYRDVPTGTLVSWKLSYLHEFASWLMQWLGSFEIVKNDELKEIIENKIEKYKELQKIKS